MRARRAHFHPAAHPGRLPGVRARVVAARCPISAEKAPAAYSMVRQELICAGPRRQCRVANAPTQTPHAGADSALLTCYSVQRERDRSGTATAAGRFSNPPTPARLQKFPAARSRRQPHRPREAQKEQRSGGGHPRPLSEGRVNRWAHIDTSTRDLGALNLGIFFRACGRSSGLSRSGGFPRMGGGNQLSHALPDPVAAPHRMIATLG